MKVMSDFKFKDFKRYAKSLFDQKGVWALYLHRTKTCPKFESYLFRREVVANHWSLAPEIFIDEKALKNNFRRKKYRIQKFLKKNSIEKQLRESHE